MQAAYLGPAIYQTLYLSVSLLLSRAAGRCFSFTVLPAVPAYCCYLPIPIATHTATTVLGRLCSFILLHPPTHTPSTLSLRADKVPRSHSTALAPCIGPARVNTAQSALDPDPLAFCSASRPLSAPPTDAPAIILIRLPQPPSHPIRIRRPTILFPAHRPPATVHCFALLCSTLPCRCPPAGSHSSPVVHKHFLAAPPTTVSAAARQPTHHTRRFALSHRACACGPTHSSRWERTVTCQQPTLPTNLPLRPCMDLSRTSKHQAPLSLPARKVASHFTSYNSRNSTPNTTRATSLGLTADVQVRRQPCPSPSLQTGFSTASCACRS